MAIEVELSRQPHERVELIEGEVVEMAPIGPRHVGCVINATRLFITRLGVEVYRGPGVDGYASISSHGPGQMVTPVAFPDVDFAVNDFVA
jgi:Uma2 family endonuclease